MGLGSKFGLTGVSEIREPIVSQGTLGREVRGVGDGEEPITSSTKCLG